MDALQNTYNALASGIAIPTDFNTANQAFQVRYRTGIRKSSEDVKAEGLQEHVSSENKASATSKEGSLGNFASMLKGEMQRVNQTQLQAGDAIQDYATGGDIPLHQVMLSINKAEMSLKMATQVRNKIVSAYQDISRMQI
jgi:flagellar hook-basal body complex protein FliE